MTGIMSSSSERHIAIETPQIGTGDGCSSNSVQAADCHEQNKVPALEATGSAVSSGDISITPEDNAQTLDTWEWMGKISFGRIFGIPKVTYDFTKTSTIVNEDFLRFNKNAPTKSIDFGNDGYTASLTNRHGLLQLTAPHPQCGLVWVRGNFPSSVNAMLARAQNGEEADGKSTFGVHLIRNVKSDLSLSSPVCHGLMGYRWPFIRYALASYGFRSGFFETCSFIKAGVVYQIVRMRVGKAHSRQSKSTPPLSLRLGGKVRFGCTCSTLRHLSPKIDFDSSLSYDTSIEGYKATWSKCQKASPCQCYLYMRLYLDGKRQKLDYAKSSETRKDSVDADITSQLDITFSPEETHVVILAYTLTSSATKPTFLDPPRSHDSWAILEESQSFVGLTRQMWFSYQKAHKEPIEEKHLNAIARCVEYICSVSAIPINTNGSANLPLEEEYPIYTNVKVASNSEYPLSSHSRQSLGDCSEATHGKENTPKRKLENQRSIALIQNISFMPCVDLESALSDISDSLAC